MVGEVKGGANNVNFNARFRNNPAAVRSVLQRFGAFPCDEIERSREEEHDYWLGAYTLNFIMTEIVFALTLLRALVATWPDPRGGFSCTAGACSWF